MFTSTHPVAHVPTTDLLSYIFDSAVERDQNLPIFIDALDPEQESISTIQARGLVRRLANGFRALGLEDGDCVCLQSPNSIYYPIVSLGIVAAGGLYTGTNPGLGVSEVIHHLKTSNTRFVICTPDLLSTTRKAAAACGILEANIFTFTALTATTPTHNPWTKLLSYGAGSWKSFDDLETSRNTVAALYPTSGTSGLPKLAKITHYNMVASGTLLHNVERRDYAVKQMLLWPMFHLASLVFSNISPLQACWQTYVIPKFEPRLFADSVQRFQCTDTGMAPAMMTAVIQSQVCGRGNKKLSSLRMGACGSAPVSSALREQWRHLISPTCTWTGAYGMTETTGIVTKIHYPAKDTTHSVGRLIANTEAKLIDDEGNEISAYGQPGELYLRGPTMFIGYFQNPQATKEAFDDEGFLKTGDVAYCEEVSRSWYIVDRKKELIKVRGFQVAPAELEGILISHEAVAEAAVVGVLSPNGDEYPRAYVVRTAQQVSESMKASEQDIVDYVASKVSSYKRLTGGVRFIDALPRNGNGKILRRVLRHSAHHTTGPCL